MLKQAVILAGGLGTRLRPLTDNTPKPLVFTGQRAFLDTVISELRRNGFTSFLILCGHMSEQIEMHFADEGDVMCLRTPSEYSKGDRIRSARNHLEKRFLLLYGDNLAHPDYETLRDERAKFTLSLSAKCPGNVSEPDSNGNVIYFPERNHDAKFVEIGYTSIDRDGLLSALDEVDDLQDAFAQLSNQAKISGSIIQGPYFSISDLDRWKITDYALKNKIILIDRDGVINKKMPQATYVDSISKIEYLEKNILGLQQLASYGYKFIVISNQAGVGRGIMTKSEVDEINKSIQNHLRLRGIEIIDFYTCFHDWNDGCICRKPKSGLLVQASRDHKMFLPQTLFIGDDERDIEAGNSVGCITVMLSDKANLSVEYKQPELICESIYDAISEIARLANKSFR